MKKQMNDQSVEINYIQVRVCLWQKDESTATVAVQQATTCHTTCWHALCFCVYNYTEENVILLQTKQHRQLLLNRM